MCRAAILNIDYTQQCLCDDKSHEGENNWHFMKDVYKIVNNYNIMAETEQI